MPHKYTTEETMKRLNNELISCESSIKRANSIARGDKEGFESLKEQLRDLRDTAKDKKDESIDFNLSDSAGRLFSPDVQKNMVLICRGQEKAFDIILDLIENSLNSISFYENEIQRIKSEIQTFKKYEVRPSEPA